MSVCRGELSARFTADNQGGWRQQPLATRALRDAPDGVTVLASRRHRNAQLDACLAWLESRCGALQRENSGSALKFCQLAGGAGGRLSAVFALLRMGCCGRPGGGGGSRR